MIDVTLMSMGRFDESSGVVTYITTLLRSMRGSRQYRFRWIRLVSGGYNAISKTKLYNTEVVYIPLPEDMSAFLQSKAVRLETWKHVDSVVDEIIPQKQHILHLHTLNLIEYGCHYKESHKCRIVSHVHCWSWKLFYDVNIELFNSLYFKYYIQKDTASASDFLMKDFERDTYLKSDAVICVTKCMKDFILRFFPSQKSKVHVVYNGLEEYRHVKSKIGSRESHSPMKCVFVGNMHRSKGLHYVLQAMEILNAQIPVSLHVVGSYSESFRDALTYRFRFLDLQFHGQMSSEQLNELYACSDVGILASTHEQCSYVALEMMRAGLPIVSTSVDGLAEILEDGKNAFLVPFSFIKQQGLTLNVVEMASHIENLYKDRQIRKYMGKESKQRYRRLFTDAQMVSRTTEVYNSVI